MIEAGYIGKTTSDDGVEMLFFNWAPVEWDQALKSRSVILILPISVVGQKLNDADIAKTP